MEKSMVCTPLHPKTSNTPNKNHKKNTKTQKHTHTHKKQTNTQHKQKGLDQVDRLLEERPSPLRRNLLKELVGLATLRFRRGTRFRV